MSHYVIPNFPLEVEISQVLRSSRLVYHDDNITTVSWSCGHLPVVAVSSSSVHIESSMFILEIRIILPILENLSVGFLETCNVS